MAPESSRLIRQITFVLVALAALAVEIAATDPRSAIESLAWVILWVGLAAVATWQIPTPTDDRRTPPNWVISVLIGLAAAPFLAEPVRRYWLGLGSPLEMLMVFGLRNLGVGLAAFAGWRLCLRLACAVSLFLMLFAISVADNAGLVILLGVYSAVGSVWLMLVYWTGLRHYFVLADTSVIQEVQPGRERMPWLAVFLSVALVGSVLGLVSAGPQRVASVLFELLPTSGGTGEYDPFARGGVNDGDDETKGDNPNSTGMTQTDTFLDSPLPSLYDMFNDLYGEPFKPKQQERAIALDSQTKVLESKKKPKDNLRANREFPTVRKSPRQPRDSSDRSARAIFEVQGRTPLHLRVTAFDQFDGKTWHEAPMNGSNCRLIKEPKSCWMAVHEQAPGNILADKETHQIKIARSPGSLVPVPPQLARFRVGRVNQADFFAWGQDRILRMAQRKTPTGIIVETESRIVDPRRLDSIQIASGDRCEYTRIPITLDPEVVRLAHAWADEHARGWPQIDAVVKHLRDDYVLNSTAIVPADCADVVGHFLLHSKSGPDYQFASSAAVLLRVLGYPTRLVSGFYAAPSNYDQETQHTPVVKEDIHFWTEVMLSNGDWLVIEPTPGFEVLAPKLSLSERLSAALFAVASSAWQHAVELGIGLLLLISIWRWRLDLLDAAMTAIWRWFPGRTWQQCIRRALLLIEWRAHLAGVPRPSNQTAPTWLRAKRTAPDDTDSDLDQLASVAEWASYGCDLVSPWGDEDVLQVGRRVLAIWTLRRWRELPQAEKGEAA